MQHLSQDAAQRIIAAVRHEAEAAGFSIVEDWSHCGTFGLNHSEANTKFDQVTITLTTAAGNPAGTVSIGPVMSAT